MNECGHAAGNGTCGLDPSHEGRHVPAGWRIGLMDDATLDAAEAQFDKDMVELLKIAPRMVWCAHLLGWHDRLCMMQGVEKLTKIASELEK